MNVKPRRAPVGQQLCLPVVFPLAPCDTVGGFIVTVVFAMKVALSVNHPTGNSSVLPVQPFRVVQPVHVLLFPCLIVTLKSSYYSARFSCCRFIKLLTTRRAVWASDGSELNTKPFNTRDKTFPIMRAKTSLFANAGI